MVERLIELTPIIVFGESTGFCLNQVKTILMNIKVKIVELDKKSNGKEI
jgi:hypothetical protein